MKFCEKCGRELAEDAVVCVGCGCPVAGGVTKPAVQTAPVENKQKEKSGGAVVFGIIGIVGAFLFALIGHIASIIGIVLGIKDYRKTGKMTGLVLSIVAEVCCIFSSIIGAVMMSGF